MDWIELLGGIAIFIYGLQLTNDGLQKRAGDQVRRWLTALTEQRLSGLLLGTLLAAVLQSTTATICAHANRNRVSNTSWRLCRAPALRP